MKNISKKTCLFVFLSLTAIVSFAQSVTPGRTPKGVVYYLPKTAIRFNLLVEKTTYIPGEFCEFAEKYFHLADVEQEKKVSYTIVNYGLTQIGVRDTSKCYSVNLKGKSATAEVHLTNDGVLQSVNAEPIQLEIRPPFKAAPHKEPANPREYLDVEVLAAGSMEKMAELTVAQIIELQERRDKILSGEMTDSLEDRDVTLQQIEQERKILMSMFIGTTTRDTTEQIVVVCPEQEVEREVIFRIDKDKGLVGKDIPTGTPYYMTIEDLHRTTLQKYDIPENKKDGGFYVNVPGKIKFTLYREDDFIGAFDLYAAQFGFVEIRSGSLFKQYVVHMALNPFTGSVEKINADM